MKAFNDNRVGLLLQASLSAPEQAVFNRPMSHHARKLLSNMFVWLIGANGPDKTKALKAFAADFDALVYEDACHKYRLDTFPGESKCKLPSFAKTKGDKSQEILDCLNLKNLQSKVWVEEHGISINPNRVSVATSTAAQNVYHWLVNHFILIDFSEHDANKIFELANGQFDFDTIKSAANNITDQDKRNVAYLYAVVRDVALKNSVIKERTKAIEDAQREKLKKVVSYHERSDYTPKVDNKSTEWARTQEYLDAFKDFKK